MVRPEEEGDEVGSGGTGLLQALAGHAIGDVGGASSVEGAGVLQIGDDELGEQDGGKEKSGGEESHAPFCTHSIGARADLVSCKREKRKSLPNVVSLRAS